MTRDELFAELARQRASLAAQSARQLAELDYGAQIVGDKVQFKREMGRTLTMQESENGLVLRGSAVGEAPWIPTEVFLLARYYTDTDALAQTQLIAGPRWYGATIKAFATPEDRAEVARILEPWAAATGRKVEISAGKVAVRVLRKGFASKPVPFARNDRQLVTWARAVVQIPEFSAYAANVAKIAWASLTAKLRDRAARADAAIAWGFEHNEPQIRRAGLTRQGVTR